MIFKAPSNPTHSVSLFLVSEDPALDNWLLVALFSLQERICLHLCIGFVNYYQSINPPSRIPQEVIRVAFSKTSDLRKDLMRQSCSWWMSITEAEREKALCSGPQLNPICAKNFSAAALTLGFSLEVPAPLPFGSLLNLQLVVSLIVLSLQLSSP